MPLRASLVNGNSGERWALAHCPIRWKGAPLGERSREFNFLCHHTSGFRTHPCYPTSQWQFPDSPEPPGFCMNVAPAAPRQGWMLPGCSLDDTDPTASLRPRPSHLGPVTHSNSPTHRRPGHRGLSLLPALIWGRDSKGARSREFPFLLSSKQDSGPYVSLSAA